MHQGSLATLVQRILDALVWGILDTTCIKAVLTLSPLVCYYY